MEWAEDRILEEENLTAASRAPLPLRELDLFRGFDDAMLAALAAPPPGRPCSQGDPETQQLRSQISDLQQQVQILEQRARIQQILREADTRAPKT